MFGANTISLPLTPLLKVIFLEVLSPFYVFQVCACLLWFLDDYEYYASAIVVASTASVTAAVYQQRKVGPATGHHLRHVTVRRISRDL